jgi:hypothetical protein
MGIILGGPKAYKVFARGEIVIALHWVNKEPSMCIFPRVKRFGGAGFILPLKVAHAYAKSDGYPTIEAVPRCVKAAQVMGMEPTKDTVNNILTAILDLIPELVSMPPEPPMLKKPERPLGEVKLFEGGREVAHTEITAGSGLH